MTRAQASSQYLALIMTYQERALRNAVDRLFRPTVH